jgi:hypothetical protein
MTKDEALKLALEALETSMYPQQKQLQAITAIKEALVQPEQEPVAFVQGCNRGQWEIFPAKAYQIFENEQPLYTTPPQRTWVGLTEREQGAIMEDLNAYGTNLYPFAQAIEAKLKEKNNG